MSRVLVVGANRGIGLAMTKQFAARGDEGVAKLAAGVGDRNLDVVVVVAGILKNVSLDDLDFQAIREQFEVNTLGPLRVATALMHRLLVGSKLCFVTSRMGSLEDNTSGGHYGYRMSKAALNMAGRSLAHDLADHGVTVLLLHPGYVRTEMTGHQGLIDAEESATGMIERIDTLGIEETGSFWHTNGERLAF